MATGLELAYLPALRLGVLPLHHIHSRFNVSLRDGFIVLRFDKGSAGIPYSRLFHVLTS